MQLTPLPKFQVPCWRRANSTRLEFIGLPFPKIPLHVSFQHATGWVDVCALPMKPNCIFLPYLRNWSNPCEHVHRQQNTEMQSFPDWLEIFSFTTRCLLPSFHQPLPLSPMGLSVLQSANQFYTTLGRWINLITTTRRSTSPKELNTMDRLKTRYSLMQTKFKLTEAILFDVTGEPSVYIGYVPRWFSAKYRQIKALHSNNNAGALAQLLKTNNHLPWSRTASIILRNVIGNNLPLMSEVFYTHFTTSMTRYDNIILTVLLSLLCILSQFSFQQMMLNHCCPK